MSVNYLRQILSGDTARAKSCNYFIDILTYFKKTRSDNKNILAASTDQGWPKKSSDKCISQRRHTPFYYTRFIIE